MEVHLPPEVETEVACLADRRGTIANALARAGIVQFIEFAARDGNASGKRSAFQECECLLNLIADRFFLGRMDLQMDDARRSRRWKAKRTCKISIESTEHSILFNCKLASCSCSRKNAACCGDRFSSRSSLTRRR